MNYTFSNLETIYGTQRNENSSNYEYRSISIYPFLCIITKKKERKKEKKMKGDRYFSNVPFQFNKMLPSLPPETLSKRSCAI